MERSLEGIPIGHTSEFFVVLQTLVRGVRSELVRYAHANDDTIPRKRIDPAEAKPAMPRKDGGTLELPSSLDIDWLIRQREAMAHHRERCEHLMRVFSEEVVAEVRREVRLLKAETAAAATAARHAARPAMPGLPDTGGDTGLDPRGTLSPEELAKMRFEVAKERSEAADAIMRLLEDYQLLTASEATSYLQVTIDDTLPQLAAIVEARKLHVASLRAGRGGTFGKHRIPDPEAGKLVPPSPAVAGHPRYQPGSGPLYTSITGPPLMVPTRDAPGGVLAINPEPRKATGYLESLAASKSPISAPDPSSFKPRGAPVVHKSSDPHALLLKKLRRRKSPTAAARIGNAAARALEDGSGADSRPSLAERARAQLLGTILAGAGGGAGEGEVGEDGSFHDTSSYDVSAATSFDGRGGLFGPPPSAGSGRPSHAASAGTSRSGGSTAPFASPLRAGGSGSSRPSLMPISAGAFASSKSMR